MKKPKVPSYLMAPMFQIQVFVNSAGSVDRIVIKMIPSESLVHFRLRETIFSLIGPNPKKLGSKPTKTGKKLCAGILLLPEKCDSWSSSQWIYVINGSFEPPRHCLPYGMSLDPPAAQPRTRSARAPRRRVPHYEVITWKRG